MSLALDRLPALSLGYSGYDGGAGGILSPVGLSARTRTLTLTLTLALTLTLTLTRREGELGTALPQDTRELAAERRAFVALCGQQQQRASQLQVTSSRSSSSSR